MRKVNEYIFYKYCFCNFLKFISDIFIVIFKMGLWQKRIAYKNIIFKIIINRFIIIIIHIKYFNHIFIKPKNIHSRFQLLINVPSIIPTRHKNYIIPLFAYTMTITHLKYENIILLPCLHFWYN